MVLDGSKVVIFSDEFANFLFVLFRTGISKTQKLMKLISFWLRRMEKLFPKRSEQDADMGLGKNARIACLLM